ncbi:MAG: hypothetical protein KAS30_02020, partial [Candidatus Diapherotrites archaeon]|nr:hypothetical protein [Candidatus Diapherotrites archaeon]
IRSLDELNYFDLDNNKFKLGDANSQLDWNVSAANQLRIKGTIVQNPGGSLSGLAVFRGAYSGIVTYYKEDTVTNDGSTWRYINVTPSSGNTPAEDTFWTVEAAKGEDGTPGTPGAPGEDGNYIEYQYAKNGSTTVPPSIVTTDLNPAGWSITPPTIGALEYLWLTKSTKNAAGDTLIIDWSTPVRIGGVPGEDGTDGTDGTDGVNARSVNLISGVQGFNYDTNGLNPSPSSTTVTATALNTTGTVYYEFLLNGVSVQNTTSNTYSYSPQADYGDMPDKIEVRIREGASVGDVLATDQMTLVGLKAGENAITVVLSNEAHTLPTNNLGVVIYDGSGTNINVWEGTTQLTVDENAPYDNSTFRVIAGVEIIIDFDTIEFADFDEEIFYVSDDTNITPGAASGDDGSNTRIYGDASAMTEDNAYIPFIIIVTNSDGVEFIFTKIQSFAKSIEGDTGDTGDTGPSGPLAMGGSDYNAGTSYHGNSVRVDIVKYLGVYYVARSDAPVSPFDGIVPTNTAYWNSFGATFDSVATDLLFATLAYIENLGVRYLRTATSGQRVEIDGTNNVIKFYNSSGVLSAVIEALGSRGYIESNLIRATELLYLSPIASVPGGVTADNYFWQDNSGNLYFVNTNGTQTQIN